MHKHPAGWPPLYEFMTAIIVEPTLDKWARRWDAFPNNKVAMLQVVPSTGGSRHGWYVLLSTKMNISIYCPPFWNGTQPARILGPSYKMNSKWTLPMALVGDLIHSRLLWTN